MEGLSGYARDGVNWLSVVNIYLEVYIYDYNLVVNTGIEIFRLEFTWKF